MESMEKEKESLETDDVLFTSLPMSTAQTKKVLVGPLMSSFQIKRALWNDALNK